MMRENHEERIRFERVLSQSRRAPVKSMTGFVVKRSPLVKLEAKGDIPMDDDGMLPLVGDE